MREIIIEPNDVKRGRPRLGDQPMTGRDRKARQRDPERGPKGKRKIAILDTETDPFDANANLVIRPFLGVLYSDEFPTIIIWEETFDLWVEKLMAALDALEDDFIIYAHNGGKFDYMFIVHKLRGAVSFKGRGIMSAKIGRHEIRDSFHIIPERLAAYQKQEFEYEWNRKNLRNAHKQAIIDYCISDCVYLLDLVKSFVDRFGVKISIGQAAKAEMNKHYAIKKLSAQMDAYLRQYFFGGRVECLAGLGDFKGAYKLIDVNSMYPDVMANQRHPIGNVYTVRRGKPDDMTAFIQLECTNYGALVRRGDNNETTASTRRGTFFTTIHEYKMALELDLIENVKILRCVDCDEFSSFEKFIVPQYDARLKTKALLEEFKQKGDTSSPEYLNVKKDDTFSKLLMNNSYGKEAQNPRKFKESWITEPGTAPEGEHWGDAPKFRGDGYWIWERPAPRQSFNNVGTAASITGAARAKLMKAINGAIDPIYCDTDSIICRDIEGVEIDATKLGAWDLEAEFDEVIIAGKKLYASRFKGKEHGQDKSYKIKSKGASGITWPEMEDLLRGKIIEKMNKAPTMTKRGDYFYMSRQIRATAKPKPGRRYEYGKAV